MNTLERWRRVDEVLVACLDLDPAQRPAHLDLACEGDPALRREVEALLAVDGRELPGLDAVTWGEPVAGLAPDSAIPEAPVPEIEEAEGPEGTKPPSLGLYRILKPIGEGGMGRVYLGRRSDGTYERDVAVKVLKEGMLGRETLGRFRNECRVLAQLEHPGIARLYDAGCTASGLPFLVMEHIEGSPLDRHLERSPGDLRSRLRLMQGICRAVSHAHRHLIVHRDLKPSNILVTPEGRPKLLDFGIAKVLPGGGPDVADWTLGRSPMTPRYASPEQRRGDGVTTATDVYSLGLLAIEVARARFGAEPDDPRDLGDLPTDLAAVLRKATAEDPTDRYPSAEQLAEEIERFLGGLPVLAREPSRGYRVRRFVGRHRGAVATAATVFILALAAAVVLAGLSLELARQRDRARVESAVSRQVTDFLVDLFAQTEPGRRGAAEPTASELLRRGADRVQTAFENRPEDAPVRAEVLTAIGRAYHELSHFDDALPVLDRALGVRRSSGAEGPDLAEALLRVAQTEYQRSDYDRAASLAREALAAIADLEGPHPLRARIHRCLGLVLTRRGHLDAAEGWLQAAADADRKLFGERGEAYGMDRRALATLAFERRDAAAAEVHAAAALNALGSALGPDHPLALTALNDLTTALQNQGKLDRAIATYHDLLTRQRRVFGERHEIVATTLNNLGTTHYDLGDFAAAERAMRESLDLLEALGAGSSMIAASVANNLARALKESGRTDEAIPLYRRALAIARSRVEPDSPSLGSPLTFLGGALCSEGQVAEGEALLDEARDIYLAALGADHYRLDLLSATRSVCREKEGLVDEARALLAGALDDLVAHFGPEHRIVHKIRGHLERLGA
ncbi:MAG: serine/threonine-protein kinase [Acidobacteriota bacterium]